MGRYEWSVALNIAQAWVLWRVLVVLDKSTQLNRRLAGLPDAVSFSERVRLWLIRWRVRAMGSTFGDPTVWWPSRKRL